MTLAVTVNNARVLLGGVQYVDNFSSVQEAANAISSAGGVLHFSAREYTNLRDILLKNNTIVEGEGKRATRLVAGGGFRCFLINNTDNLTFRQMSMDIATADSFAAAIKGDECKELIFSECIFTNSVDESTNPEDTLFAIKTRGNDTVIVEKCDFIDTELAVGPYINNPVSRGIFIDKCRFVDSKQFAIFAATPAPGAVIDGLYIRDCDIESPRSAGVLFGDDSPPGGGESQTLKNVSCQSIVNRLVASKADLNCKGVFGKLPRVAENITVSDIKVEVDNPTIADTCFAVVLQSNEITGLQVTSCKRVLISDVKAIGCRNGAVRLDIAGEDITIEKIKAVAAGRGILINAVGDITGLTIKDSSFSGLSALTNCIEINANGNNITDLNIDSCSIKDYERGIRLDATTGLIRGKILNSQINGTVIPISMVGNVDVQVS